MHITLISPNRYRHLRPVTCIMSPVLRVFLHHAVTKPLISLCQTLVVHVKYLIHKEIAMADLVSDSSCMGHVLDQCAVCGEPVYWIIVDEDDGRRSYGATCRSCGNSIRQDFEHSSQAMIAWNLEQRRIKRDLLLRLLFLEKE